MDRQIKDPVPVSEHFITLCEGCGLEGKFYLSWNNWPVGALDVEQPFDLFCRTIIDTLREDHTKVAWYRYHGAYWNKKEDALAYRDRLLTVLREKKLYPIETP